MGAGGRLNRGHVAVLGRVLSLAAVVLALYAGSAASATAVSKQAAIRATALIPLENAAPKLTAYDGYVVFSRHEKTGKWRLLAWHDGAVSSLNVPERGVPFDAAAGPSSAGAPTVVFSKCSQDPSRTDDWGQAAGCQIYELALPDGSPRLVGGVFAANASDTTPAIWKNELAFARLRPGARAPNLYIWNRTTRRLNRVGGGPTACESYSRQPCETKPQVLAWVQEMSLDSSSLAYQWALPESIPGFGAAYAEIRVDPLRGDRQGDATKVVFYSIAGGACNGQEGGSPDAFGSRVIYIWHGSVCAGEPPRDSFIATFEPTRLVSSRVHTGSLAVAVAQDHGSTYWIRVVQGHSEPEANYAESCEPAFSVCTLMRSERLAGQPKPG